MHTGRVYENGPEGIGLLSFPKTGTSIALDIAIRRDTQALVDALNERVIADGGRIYLAKDSRVRPQLLPSMYPELERWQKVRHELDPDHQLRSDMSRRLWSLAG